LTIGVRERTVPSVHRANRSVRLPSLRRVAFVGAVLSSLPAGARHGELPNRVPEPAPYNVSEARIHPPPYEAVFAGQGNPAVCGSCHQQIFAEWNGSMMSNAWRDPAWRAAFLLIARLTATDGNCDVPQPPDGTPRAKINPFANEDCSSTFDIGKPHVTRGSGSLLDGFCSRCHMPANYMDNVPLENVTSDALSGREHGLIDPTFDPTSARGTPFAFATLAEKSRNTEPGQLGITCSFCHTIAETRETPFHNYPKSGTEYREAAGKGAREKLLAPDAREMLLPADPKSPTLGYAVGAGAYRISPQALVGFERFGPLSQSERPGADAYVSGVFGRDVAHQKGAFETSSHKGSYHVLFERAEMCATCHDVTNPLTIKNKLGRWVGGFPIERTYSEWSHSRYADRPGNRNFEPRFKRDCQTCHMQQTFGQPGTAQTLYGESGSVAPLTGKLSKDGPERGITFSHHFIGGNTYSTHLVGANATADGKPEPYPELSVYSFSSDDHHSPYHNAVWQNLSASGPPTQHVRLAWDRLRHAVELEVSSAKRVSAGGTAAVRVRVKNTGTGHNFPTGFPEGRNAWVALRAFDSGTGRELEIADSFWKRRSLGVGYLTDKDTIDPNFPGCKWEVPAGAPDPYAYQFRAVASLGGGCPTLDLPYAAPLNLVVDARGFPIDAKGSVVGRENPLGTPQFHDVDGDGDLYDDSFLLDTRLRPMPHAGSSLDLDRYAVVIPGDAVGPIAVTAAVYYQSMEAVVAKKFMGNMADTDGDGLLEPCVLKAACDGRVPTREPAVVEGAPPVPMRVTTTVVHLEGKPDTSAPLGNLYPSNDPTAYRDVVPKVTFTEPVAGIDERTFTMTDAGGAPVPAAVAQISDTTYALFPNEVFLKAGKVYEVRVADPVCDTSGNCKARHLRSRFTVATAPRYARGDTRPPRVPELVAELALPPPSADAMLARRGGIFVLVAGLFALLGYAVVLRRRPAPPPVPAPVRVVPR
jgi:hypothetical protein